jgi:hypothetical protein
MQLCSLLTRVLIICFLIILYSCDKLTIETTRTGPDPVSREAGKRDYPVPLGCIRGYFGNEYRKLTLHIEQVQATDSFSNAYFYGSCNGTLKQINLIRRDTSFVIAIYIMGVSPDSLPIDRPVTPEIFKYTEIQFYKSGYWNSVSNDINYYHYNLIDSYGKSVLITENKDDILAGTFEGDLVSAAGDRLHVSEGEFRIKILRKYMPCGR